MTAHPPTPDNYPPPPPGGYYPPPPGDYPRYPGSGYPPPPPPPPPPRVLPREAYTPWSRRLLAFLIDWTPFYILLALPYLVEAIEYDASCAAESFAGDSDCSSDPTDLYAIVALTALLLMAVYFFWNFCYRQGKTGQSIGKSVLKFKVISEKPGNPSASGGHSCAKSPTTSTNSSATSAICFRCGTTSAKRSPTRS